MPKMETFLHENHRGSPTSTLLNVLNILNVLNVLKMSKDPSLACWALFLFISLNTDGIEILDWDATGQLLCFMAIQVRFS